MPVVGDEQDGAVEVLQGLLQHVGAGDVQVVGGLVQTQQGLRRHEHFRQGETPLLAAGEHRHLLVHGVPREQKRAQQAAHLGDGPAGRGMIQLLEDGVARVQLFQLVLGVVGEIDVHAIVDGARIGLFHAGDHLQKRRLARAVGAHERHLVAAVHREVDAVVHRVVAVALHETARPHHLISRARRLHEVEVHRLLLLGDDRQRLLDLLDAPLALLGLLGLGGLVTEAVDEGLQVRDLLQRFRTLRLDALQALLACHQVLRVVALVQVHFPVVDFRHAVDHVVHEGAVVRDHDDGAGVAAQEALEPLHRFQIEMVRRLVEQQHLGVADEQFRKRDAHLPTAGELGGGTGHVALGEAEAEQHASHFRLQRVAAEHLVGVPRPAHGRQLSFGGVRAQLRLQLVQALLRFKNLGLGRDDLFEDGQVPHLDGLLLQIAHARPLGEEHAPLVRIVLAGDNVEQRRLARAVRAHERQPVVLFQAERHVVEQRAAAVGFRKMFSLQDHKRFPNQSSKGESEPPRFCQLHSVAHPRNDAPRYAFRYF